MLIGLIRPVETRAVEVQGASIAELTRTVEAQTPDGWEVTAIPVRMSKGSTVLSSTATIARRDGAREIDADTVDGLWAKVPDGWQLLSYRVV